MPAWAPNREDANGWWAQVTRVVDGDTIVVGNEKVRLKCIDTPETKDTRKPVECYGPEASKFSTKSLTGKRVHLELDPLDARTNHQDHRGRTLAYVFLEDGTLFNLELMQLGFAHTTPYPCSHKSEFKRAEVVARNAGLGLWGACAAPHRASDCSGTIVGNRRSHVYHRSDQEAYRIASENRVCFDSEEDAIGAHYRAAKR